MTSKIKVSFIVMLVGLFLSSCNNSGGSVEGQREFVDALSNLTGDDYRLVKKDTLIDGFIVLKNSNTGGYVAYNLGVNLSPVAVVAPIVAAHPVATIALAIVFMRERPQVLQWMGAIVTVTAVIALSAQ